MHPFKIHGSLVVSFVGMAVFSNEKLSINLSQRQTIITKKFIKNFIKKLNAKSIAFSRQMVNFFVQKI